MEAPQLTPLIKGTVEFPFYMIISAILFVLNVYAAPCDDLRELMTAMGLRMPVTNVSCCVLRGISCNEAQEITGMYLHLIRTVNNPNLHGRIPSRINILTSLEVLSMSGNLGGPIPRELYSLNRLRTLNLTSNALDGPVSGDIQQLVNLEILDLSSNSFTGSLPAEMGQLKKLTYLNVGYNSFSGRLPPQLADVTTLREYRAETNQFDDIVPPEYSKMTELTVL